MLFQLLRSVANETAAMQSQWNTSVDTFNDTSAIFSQFLANAAKNSLLSRVSNVHFNLTITDPVFDRRTDFYNDVTKANVDSKQATAISSFLRALHNFTAVSDMFRGRSIVLQQVLLSYKAREKVSLMFNIVQTSTTIAAQETVVSLVLPGFRRRFKCTVVRLSFSRSLNGIVDNCKKQWRSYMCTSPPPTLDFLAITLPTISKMLNLLYTQRASKVLHKHTCILCKDFDVNFRSYTAEFIK